jgi:hypothetical protein
MLYDQLRRLVAILESFFVRWGVRFSLLRGLLGCFIRRVHGIPVFAIQGALENGEGLTTLFVGSEQSAYRFAGLAYSEIGKMGMLGKVCSWQVDRLNMAAADIAVVGAKGLSTHRALKTKCLFLPNVSFALDLCRSDDELSRRMSRRRRRDVKKLKRLGYRYSISQNRSEDFDFFYTRMYVPYVRRRFSKAALVAPYHVSRTLYGKNGGIIFVKKRKRVVAGILFQTKRDVLYAMLFGVYEGEEEFVKNLAGTAALRFLIQWAQENNMRGLDYGRTMPFFKDGIFRYKQEWGMHVKVHADQPFCALRLNPHSETALSFLAQNPCVVYQAGSMTGLVAVDHQLGEREFHKICSEYFVPGLESLTIVCRTSDSNLLRACIRRTDELQLDKGAESTLSACLPLKQPGRLFCIHRLKSTR